MRSLSWELPLPCVVAVAMWRGQQILLFDNPWLQSTKNIRSNETIAFHASSILGDVLAPWQDFEAGDGT